MSKSKEKSLLPRRNPSEALKRSKHPMNWILKCNRTIKGNLMISLHDQFCHDVERKETLTYSLQNKYRELILCLYKEFPDLKNIKESLEKNIRLSDKQTSQMLALKLFQEAKEKFGLILNWYRENDPWALEDASRAASKKLILQAISGLKQSYLGDRPQSLSREDSAKEAEENKGKKTVAEIFKD